MANDLKRELNQIQCPKCGNEFSVTEAMAGDIHKELEEKFRRQAQVLQAELKQKHEIFLKEKEAFSETLTKKLSEEKVLLERKIKEEQAKQSEIQVQDLKTQVLEKDKRVQDLTRNELELRQKARQLEEADKARELDYQRKLDAQKTAMEEDLRKALAQEYLLKSAEKDLQIASLRKQAEEMKRKAEQGSQQMQGEALELEIERALAGQFPLDAIVPVGKGQKGGDIVQEVRLKTGQEAGKILYELKNTKNWSDGWLVKAKDDQRLVKAAFVVLITTVMPKDTNEQTAFVDGVWVCTPTSFHWLAMALRSHLTEVFFAHTAAQGKGEKLDSLYHYMIGSEFRQRIEATVEAFRSMQEGLASERRAMNAIWSKREKCLEKVIMNTTGLYGDIQGIVGTTLPKIASLELEPLALLEGPEVEV